MDDDPARADPQNKFWIVFKHRSTTNKLFSNSVRLPELYSDTLVPEHLTILWDWAVSSIHSAFIHMDAWREITSARELNL